MPDSTPPRVTRNGDGSFSINVHSQPVGEMPEVQAVGALISGLTRVVGPSTASYALPPEVVQVPYEQHKQMERRITRQRWQLRALNRSIVGLKHYVGDMQGTLDRVRKNRDQWRDQALSMEQEVARRSKEIQGLARQLALLNRLLTNRNAELDQAEKRAAVVETPKKRRWWQ